MPAATNKADLTAVTRRDFAKLEKLIAGIEEQAATAKIEDDTSIKDVIGHRCHWIDLFLSWHADGEAGREVHIPAKGYKWNQLKDYNAKIRAERAGNSWADEKATLEEGHARLMRFIEGLPDEALYGTPMIGNDKWTTGRFAEASGASHYRSAAKFIRAALRGAG